MKIVYLNSSGQLGGTENVLLDLLSSIRAAEPSWQLHLIAAEHGPLAGRAFELGVESTVLPFPPGLARLGDSSLRLAREANGDSAAARKLLTSAPATLNYVRRLRSLLARLNPNTIHTHGLKMHVLGLWARPSRVPVVWHMHDYVGSRPVMARLLQLHARRCSAAIANSQSVANDVRSVCGEGLTVQAIYNAVNLDVFKPEGLNMDLDRAGAVESATPQTVRVGLLGAFGRWKGHQTFLEAIALLPADLPVRAYVIGDALYQTEGSQYTLDDLRLMADQLGIKDKVVFTGFVDNAPAAIRALDVVVHASIAPEPFGLVIAEAMACGRALIVSRLGGALELIEEGKNALAHPAGDARVLAQRIERLVLDKKLRTQLGIHGRATAESRFDHRRLASEMIPVYRGLFPRTASAEP